MYINITLYIYFCIGIHARKLVSGGHGRAAKLGACVNWADWLRTSADKRMWSGRRTVVMVR